MFQIRLNSIIYSVFCVSFPVLFTKLDNYSEYEAGWRATKPAELLSSWTYRVVESCERSVKGGQRIGPSGSATARVFFADLSYWNNLFTSNSLHSTHSTLLFSFPPSTTHTHTQQKATGKTGGSENGPSRGCWRPLRLSAYLNTAVSLTLSRQERGLAEAQTLLGTLFQMTTKRKKVSVESVGPAVFFTPDECGSLGADTLYFSVGPGYTALPEHWSTILLSVQKSLLCSPGSAKEKKRLYLIITTASFLLLQTDRTT